MKWLSRLLSIIIILLIILIVYKNINLNQENKNAVIKTKEYINDTSVFVGKNVIESTNNLKNKYIGVLEINKIALKRGFVEGKDNVDEDIVMIESSNLNNLEDGYIILAAHSGSSYNSYFHNLDNLKKGDRVSIYNSGKKYNYIVVSTYEVKKQGYISINPLSQGILYLTTCSEENEDNQLIIETKLSNVEDY